LIKVEHNWANIKTQLLTRLKKLGEEITARMGEQAPVGSTGNLQISFDYAIHSGEQSFQLEVGTIYDYGEYVEFGTRKHWVPFKPLRRWVEAKIQPHQIGLEQVYSAERTWEGIKGAKRKMKTVRGVKREAMIARITKAIQFSIARKGTRANPYCGRALQSLGLPYVLSKEAVGWKYDIDISKWLNQQIDELLPRLLK
jgi:hypothetical protein